MVQGQLSWIANFIWGIADDVLRDLYVRGKYRDVILPTTVLRLLDAVLEPSKQAVLDVPSNRIGDLELGHGYGRSAQPVGSVNNGTRAVPAASGAALQALPSGLEAGDGSAFGGGVMSSAPRVERSTHWVHGRSAAGQSLCRPSCWA